MIPNKNIFCTSPWFELHIYWDGTYGFCCAEDHKIYPTHEYEKYNVRNMTIKQWMNSQPMKDVRSKMFGDSPLSICHSCQQKELSSGTSRRHNCNSKSIIFTKTNFVESFQQSPHSSVFKHTFENNGDISTYPIDLHIDLGNYCNLACKMCSPLASSKIAKKYKEWDIDIDNKKRSTNKTILSDWTKDQATWQKVTSEIISFRNLKNIHFMGGETLLTKRFSDFLDLLILNKKTDIGLSFVTNGTIIDHVIIEKLKKIQGRVNIELSIETITEHNSYIRQGTDTPKVVKNIFEYMNICKKNTWDFTIRPAISLLSVGYYHTLLEFCLQNKLLIKSMLVNYPDYLQVKHLPYEIKKSYMEKYQELIRKENLDEHDFSRDYNESDKNEFRRTIAKESNQIIDMLQQPQITNSDKKLDELIVWCERWDNVYEYDLKTLYPEFRGLFRD